MSKNFRSGYLDRDGNIRIEPEFYVVGKFGKEIAAVKKWGKRKYSVIDRQGKFLFEDVFESFGKWSDGVMWLNEGGVYNSNNLLSGGSWRFVDEFGKTLVEMNCSNFYDFSEGLGGVVIEGKWGAIDRSGKIAIDPIFNFLGKFSCGLAIANEGGLDGYVDKKGKWVIKPNFEMAYDFSEDVGSVKMNGLIYLIDRQGGVISEGFDSISVFQNGIAWVKKNGLYSFIDKNGKLIKDVWVENFKGTGGGLCGLLMKEGWFFMNKESSLTGPYEDIMLPNEGLARVMKNGLWGFIDLEGKEIIQPQFFSAYGFTEGLAGVCERDKWHFIDKKGARINSDDYDYVGLFSENRAPVMKNGLWGIIDENGKTVCDCKFGRIDGFSNGLAPFVSVQWELKEPSYEKNWTVMPENGFSNKIFSGANKYDVFRVIVGFSGIVDGDQYEKLSQIINNWEYLLKASSFKDCVFEENDIFISNWNLSFLASNIFDPKRALAALFEEFKEEGFPINEVIFIKLCEPGEEFKLNIYKKRAAVKHPDHDFGTWWFEDLPTYLKSVFDKNSQCPASETATDLIGVKTDLSMPEGMRYEERTMPLYVPGIRICYGVVQNRIISTDERTNDIEDSVVKSFEENFSHKRIWVYPPPADGDDWYVPKPLRNDNTVGLEKIEHEGRKGYLFAVEPYRLEQNFSTKYFRFREQEMMEALSQVIREKNLEEVITWQRFGDVPQNAVGFAGMAWPKIPYIYELNLWEKNN